MLRKYKAEEGGGGNNLNRGRGFLSGKVSQNQRVERVKCLIYGGGHSRQKEL